jgi:hypothetical protein
MKLSDLYSEYIANWLSEGLLITRDKISLLGIRSLFDSYITNGWITKTWIVSALPVHFDVNLTQAIRSEMHEAFPDVKTIVHMYNSPVNVSVNNENFRRQLKIAANQYNRYKDDYNGLSEDEKLTGLNVHVGGGYHLRIDKTTLLTYKASYDSFSYVFDKVNHGSGFTSTYYFVQASAKTRAELRKYQKMLLNVIRSTAGEFESKLDNIYVREVHGTVDNYLSNFCPATFKQQPSSKFPTLLLSDENKAALLPTKTKGLINATGVLIGLDWQAKLPFFQSFFDNGAAQVALVDGKTGCGKTFFMFFVAIELAGIGVHGSVIDIKGNEWSKIMKFIKGSIEIKMTGKNARFVNTLRLDNIQCNKDNCEELYDNAVQGTIDIFTIIVKLQENEGNIADLVTVLETAINKLYSQHDVVRDNPETFVRTRDFKYSDIIDIVIDLKTTKSFSDAQRRICGLIQTRSAPFFISEGRYADAMKNELTVSEIIESPFVIYNMNKNNAETLSTLDDLKIYMSQFLDGEKHFLRKQQKLHTAAFYEELQRCGSLSTLVRSISARVTGSRSNNLSVFLLLNAITTLDSDAFRAIKSNITTKMIGYVEEPDQNKLVEEYGCDDIKSYMERIRTNEKGYYNNCFAVSFNTGLKKDKVLLKSVVPKEMIEAFNTRDSFDI